MLKIQDLLTQLENERKNEMMKNLKREKIEKKEREEKRKGVK